MKFTQLDIKRVDDLIVFHQDDNGMGEMDIYFTKDMADSICCEIQKLKTEIEESEENGK